ncbi:5,10-methylenetetrahydromethanopterin reductase [Catenulispora sp. MAP12-49]|jgi:5,10-methylenetetrahydromethanopterin reductase|uniref:LLM class flavin-dependent oxidoreductase n=1 Tax=Catenulispora sp. MAP12-49 TaxID=3156302 RepID=UPI0035124081
MGPEFWLSTRSVPGSRRAAQLEAAGFDGLAFNESQNRAGDPYVALTAAAVTTSRIQLATGVTNPWTRHPAVTASAIASVQAEAGGNRVSLGLGRGDSALAHLGLRPAPLPVFRWYLTCVQAYLRGEEVPMEEAARGASHLIADGRLPLADLPSASRLEWVARLPPEQKVPVWVAASGPQVIRTAAELADRVTLAVGADPDRVAWAIRLARSVRPDVPIGAFVNVDVHDDPGAALRRAGGRIASFARFSAMYGEPSGPLAPGQREVLSGLAKSYQMTRHGGRGSQSEALTPEFAERFAVLGSPARCRERLEELAALGVDRFHIIGPDSEYQGEFRKRFLTEVMRPLRADLRAG